MRAHYHVLTGLPGCYMPDNNNAHTTRRDAESDARWQVRQIRDEGMRVRGSARRGYYQTTTGQGVCVQITRCTVADCIDNNAR